MTNYGLLRALVWANFTFTAFVHEGNHAFLTGLGFSIMCLFVLGVRSFFGVEEMVKNREEREGHLQPLTYYVFGNFVKSTGKTIKEKVNENEIGYSKKFKMSLLSLLVIFLVYLLLAIYTEYISFEPRHGFYLFFLLEAGLVIRRQHWISCLLFSLILGGFALFKYNYSFGPFVGFGLLQTMGLFVYNLAQRVPKNSFAQSNTLSYGTIKAVEAVALIGIFYLIFNFLVPEYQSKSGEIAQKRQIMIQQFEESGATDNRFTYILLDKDKKGNSQDTFALRGQESSLEVKEARRVFLENLRKEKAKEKVEKLKALKRKQEEELRKLKEKMQEEESQLAENKEVQKVDEEKVKKWAEKVGSSKEVADNLAKFMKKQEGLRGEVKFSKEEVSKLSALQKSSPQKFLAEVKRKSVLNQVEQKKAHQAFEAERSAQAWIDYVEKSTVRQGSKESVKLSREIAQALEPQSDVKLESSNSLDKKQLENLSKQFEQVTKQLADTNSSLARQASASASGLDGWSDTNANGRSGTNLSNSINSDSAQKSVGGVSEQGANTPSSVSDNSGTHDGVGESSSSQAQVDSQANKNGSGEGGGMGRSGDGSDGEGNSVGDGKPSNGPARADTMESGLNEEKKKEPEKKDDFKVPDNWLEKLLALAMLVLVIGVLYYFIKKVDRKKVNRLQLPRHAKKQFLKSFNVIINSKTTNQDKVVKCYHLLLSMMEASNLGKQEFESPTRYAYFLSTQMPFIGEPVGGVTETFCDCLYGRHDITQSRLEQYLGFHKKIFDSVY